MASINDINWLLNKYYGDNPELKRIVTIHSENVAKKALHINRVKNLGLDPRDVYCAARLHDIGVVKCYAPDIHSFGDLPYIQHGIEGKKILEAHGLTTYAGVCETHTGAGLTKEDIIKNHLPLPERDYLPGTLLEQLICYADKFFSKGKDLNKEKSVEEIIIQMKNYGEDSLKRFMSLHNLFSLVN